MRPLNPKFCLFVLLLSAITAGAQDVKSLQFSVEEQKTLDRLNTFDTLDLGAWRYHLGDIPNGEDPSLNDSSWQPIGPTNGLPSDATWFRHEIVVPKTLNGYDLRNARVEFHFNLGAAGPAPMIIYLDGRMVAMGTDIAPIVIWEKATPGDHALIAVKGLATDAKKNFKGARVTVTTNPSRPSPGDLYKEITADAWLVPAVPAAASKGNLLQEAIDAVNTRALDSGDQASFDASLRHAQQLLGPLRPLLQSATVHMVGNSHMDAAWMWPWTETVEVVRQTLGTSVQLMDEYPQYTYTQSAAQYFAWMQDKYPALFQRIQKRVKEGRFEIVGGMWVEPDLNIPSGESLVRQILIGKRYFQKELGVDVKVGWNPDSFGYNWQLPQIYKKSGIDYFVTQKMAWSDTNQLPLKLFWWQAPDGSRILTYFPHGYSNGTGPVEIAKDYAQAASLNPGADEMMHLYGVGDHGGGPTRTVLNQALHWQQPDKVFPRLEFGSSLSFFQTMEKRLSAAPPPVWNYATLPSANKVLPVPSAGSISLPVWNDELYLEYHRGAYTTQAAEKRNIREGEERTLNAEKYSSLAWLGGMSYPQDSLNRAWKKVLFNEFHDLAAGTGIATIYRDAADDFQEVRFRTEEATSQARNALISSVDTRTPQGTAPVLVFNMMAWKRTDILKATVQLPVAAEGIAVSDARGHSLPVQVLEHQPHTNTFQVLLRADNVPSLGYEKLIAAPPLRGAPAISTDLHASGTTLENRYLRIVIDPRTGCITSLWDKAGAFESIAAGSCGNELQAFHDVPKSWDAWNIDAGYDQHPFDLGPAVSVRLVESGPLRAVVRVEHATKLSRFLQDITLYAGIDRVEVANSFDWHEEHVLLKAAVPLAASAPMAAYEIPYGTIERPTTRNNSFENARFEVPALRWADLGDKAHGLALINNSKYGYDAKGNVLRLTLLRSTVSPDPEADRGQQQFTYALYPHAGEWKQSGTEREAWDFNSPLQVVQPDQYAGSLPAEYSFVEAGPNNIILTAVKKAEDDNALVLRFYEWAGKSTHVTISLPHKIKSAISTDLMEKPDPQPVQVQGRSVTMDVKPYSINTIKVNLDGRGATYWQQP